MNDTTLYTFVGEGQGVPGLPHRLTKADAAALGVTELLDAAIANGNYAPTTGGAPSTTNKRSRPGAATAPNKES